MSAASRLFCRVVSGGAPIIRFDAGRMPCAIAADLGLRNLDFARLAARRPTTTRQSLPPRSVKAASPESTAALPR